MNSVDMSAMQEAARAFRNSPDPARADKLLKLMAPHRCENLTIQQLIDEVLEYKFLVGSIPSSSGVATG